MAPPPPPPPPPRDLDLVVFGATGFTGKLVAEHLARSYSSGENKVRYALAGRDAARLEAARAEVAGHAPAAAAAELVAVDPTDHEALVRVFGRARAVISTAGPYQLYGTPIVKAAVVSCQFFFFFFFGEQEESESERKGKRERGKKGATQPRKKKRLISIITFLSINENRTPERTTATSRASSRGSRRCATTRSSMRRPERRASKL